MSVAREREQGTFDQLLVTPFRPGEIIVGKAGACMLVGTVQATNVLLVAQLWFHIPFAGSFLVLYSGLLLFLLSAVGIGLFLSSISQTMQQAMFYGMLFMNPFALLSGLTTPIGNMPVALQYLTVLNPLRYAIEIAQRVYLEGAGIGLLMPDLVPLAIIALVTLTVSTSMFRGRLAG
jgi:ABC-2 type transport system permease protein